MGENKAKPVMIWTDGSCHPNPNGKGGWAFLAEWKGRKRTRHGCKRHATNNEMELEAVLHALLFVRPTGAPIHIFTDSKYVVKCINDWCPGWRANGWINSQGKPVKNKNLIDRIRRLLDMHRTHNNNNTHIQWTKGHSGNKRNEMADALAGIARMDQATDWTDEDNRTKL